jgi:hypothetical protein
MRILSGFESPIVFVTGDVCGYGSDGGTIVVQRK